MTLEEIPFDPRLKYSDVERIWIDKALRYYKGNVTAVADRLKLSRASVYNKIKKYGLYGRYRD